MCFGMARGQLIEADLFATVLGCALPSSGIGDISATPGHALGADCHCDFAGFFSGDESLH
jgi:hypothetical protein